MQPWFIATEKFDPTVGDRWTKYVEWSGLTQLREVVSLDSMLCPPVLTGIKDDYWPFIVNEDYLLDFWIDLGMLRREIVDVGNRNLLCVFRDPDEHPTPGPGYEEFRFVGYDLVDRWGGASPLTNCGGFKDVFSTDELSPQGLLTSHARAIEVRDELRRLYPEDPHADCHAWAIFRAVEP